MRLTETFVLYGMIGFACGFYMARTKLEGFWKQVLFLLAAIPFWPLLLPMMQGRGVLSYTRGEPIFSETSLLAGPYGKRIGQALLLIQATIEESGEWTRGVLSVEQLKSIGRQLHLLDTKIAEIVHTLKKPAFSSEKQEQLLRELQDEQSGSLAQESARICLKNIQQLQMLLQDYKRQMEDMLLLLERVHSQMTLLRFSTSRARHSHTELEQLILLVESLQEALPATDTPSEPSSQAAFSA